MAVISAPGALWGGFASFFSVWQACILQISPFFLAYMAGLYLTAGDNRSPSGKLVLTPALFFLPGFALFYSFVNSSGIMVSRYIFQYIDGLRLFSGLFILLVGLTIVLAPALGKLKKWDSLLGRILVSVLLGVTFAVVYMPCISPTLSKILSVAGHPDTAEWGSVLAFLYATGLSIALILTGLAILYLLHSIKGIKKNPGAARIFFGFVVAILGFLNLTGYMVEYKSLVLGYFTS